MTAGTNDFAGLIGALHGTLLGRNELKSRRYKQVRLTCQACITSTVFACNLRVYAWFWLYFQLPALELGLCSFICAI
jgi:hypothetical protein